MDGWIDRYSHRQTDRQTDIQMYGKTDRQGDQAMHR